MGVGLVLCVVLAIGSGALSCQPGVLNCDEFPEAAVCIVDGTGGGMGGDVPPPAGCSGINVTSLADMETNFLASRCGTGPMGTRTMGFGTGG